MRERRVNRNPLRKVTRPVTRQGMGSMMLSGRKMTWWELELECGHTVERNVKWRPPANGERAPRGWGSQWAGGPSLDRLPEPPKTARCEFCGEAERRGAA